MTAIGIVLTLVTIRVDAVADFLYVLFKPDETQWSGRGTLSLGDINGHVFIRPNRIG
jgi:hypothetical protein